MTSWSDFLQSLLELKELDASYCDIITIQNGMFSNLPHLEYLDLQGNRLTNFDEVETCFFQFFET
jgi:Leucine-rich repeat (LRR) protein